MSWNVLAARRLLEAGQLREGSAFERAPEGIGKLRGLVIELALSGRLVQGDPQDRSAQEGLARASLLLGGQRSREVLGLSPAPYALPPQWEWTQPQRIGRISPRNSISDEALAGFVPMNAIPVDYGQELVPEKRRWGDMKKGYTHFADGDVVVAKITPCFQNGKACVVKGLPGGAGAGTTELHVIRPVSQVVFPKYLLLFFRSPSFVAGGIARMTGTAGQQRVSGEYFAAVAFPLPPLAEQVRIMEVVDQLMALCDGLEAKASHRTELGDRLSSAALGALVSAEAEADFALAWKRLSTDFTVMTNSPRRAQRLQQAVGDLALRGRLVPATALPSAATALGEMRQKRRRLEETKAIRRFPSPSPIASVPYSLPPGWSWVRLGDLCLQVADGPHFSPKYVRRDDGVLFLSGRNIRVTGFDLSDVKYVSPEDHEAFCERVRPAFGDVLYTKGGTTGVALVNTLKVPFSVWVHVAVLKLAGDKWVLPEYVALALNSPHCYAQSQEYTHGTGNRDLGLTRMVNITLPLPPRSVQEAIVHRARDLVTLGSELEAALVARDGVAAKLARALTAGASR